MNPDGHGLTLFEVVGILIPAALLGLSATTEGAQSSGAPQISQSTFRVDVKTIEVPLTVLDSSGRIVTHIRREDFTLFEDGLPQDIRSLTLDTQNVNVVLLLDLSRSVRSQLKNIKHAARRFIDTLGPQDKVAIIAFSQRVELVQDWTTQKKKLHRAVERLQAGTYTQLYDAIHMAVGKYLTGITGKKAIVLITDGVDAISDTSYARLRETILRHQASIYIINLLNSVKGDMARYRRVAFIARAMEKLGERDYLEKFFKGKEEEMNLLAKSTGGRTFYPAEIDSLEGIYEQVARELKSQFLLTYIPNNPGAHSSYREISLSYRLPDFKLLHRRGYYND